MKKIRQKKILELIENNNISTQEQILELLTSDGFNVTQATVSRDIKELNLIKIRNKKGFLKYTLPGGHEKKAEPILKSSVLHADSAGNIAVLKCKSGMASAVCAELDMMHYPNMVGTIAGDDTIFILFRTYLQAEEFKNNYNRE